MKEIVYQQQVIREIRELRKNSELGLIEAREQIFAKHGIKVLSELPVKPTREKITNVNFRKIW